MKQYVNMNLGMYIYLIVIQTIRITCMLCVVAFLDSNSSSDGVDSDSGKDKNQHKSFFL